MTSEKIRDAFATLALHSVTEEYRKIGVKSIFDCCIISDLPYNNKGQLAVSWKNDDVNVLMSEITDKKTEKPVNGNNVYATLHSKSFSLIYLETKDSCVKYLESAAHSISHKGILVITSQDISTLFNKCPERAMRLYNGRVIRCDFTLELAARLILANVARALARWDKGLLPLICFADVNGVMVIVKVLKGSKHADNSMKMIQKVAYCCECSGKRFIAENQYASSKSTAELLNCICFNNNTAGINPPITLLGPVWAGKIFETNFLMNICNYVLAIETPKNFMEILKTTILEAFCNKNPEDDTALLSKINLIIEAKIKDEATAFKCLYDFKLDKQAFYYCSGSYGVPGLNPPKLSEIITELHKRNFQASRTHFNSKGIRTSATNLDMKRAITSIIS